MTSGQEAAVVSMFGPGPRQLDLGDVARNQVAAARAARGMSEAEFAHLLDSLLGWPVKAGFVAAWESTSTPPGDVLVACELIVRQSPPDLGNRQAFDAAAQVMGDRFVDLEAVYSTRSEFQAKLPTSDLLEGAKEIRACGLSLNMLCQTYSDVRLRELVEQGTTLRCLFLKPYGHFIREREQEEGYPENRLSDLTAMNLMILREHVAGRVSPEAQERIEIGVYDEPIRFNVLLVDTELCVAQTYLPQARGVDSPTFVIRKRRPSGGLYSSFEQVFSAMWERREPA
ncbi:DUF5919 domain-containing protein [Streptomyces chartreusis]|uniref:DUF5919 domain-containing protein n=1 Tax=Streptomyces chartreusis TaxID=1969 RepID=UPI0016781BB3|nr:DUF5919 domain-containing protein [Streptomyces chartreusis]GGX58895.1 hypothetical protein GCM10010321_89470 [Streptomyces chartreusis]